MFVLSNFTRLLSYSPKVLPTCGHIRTTRLNLQNVVDGVDKLTFDPIRCYSEDRRNNKKSPSKLKLSHESYLEENNESIEVFDLEKERNKLHHDAELSKYQAFKDDDAPIILDVEEEKIFSQTTAATQLRKNEFDGISLERGVHGVFDVADLVTVLRKQSAQEIAVIAMPTEVGYADHMIIVTGKSTRHLKALADHVRKLFKKKMNPSDKIPVIEGKVNKSDEWLALDMGNIILHIFSKRTREIYDLESLWTLGPEFDPHLNEVEDPMNAILRKHSTFLADLEPADKTS